MTLGVGWVIDRIGTKLGLALSLIVWSICGIANAFVGRLLVMHIVIRSAFAVGEAGNFPASIKTVAEWFPKRERALATGIFNSGSNFGAMVAALFVPWCMIHFGDQRGWKMAFILTGAAGFLWLIFWYWLYDTPDKQRRLSKAEHDYIHIDDEAAAGNVNGDKGKLSWWRLFGYRQAWAFFCGKFMTDGIWWFYLFWLPDYLIKQFGMTKAQVMMPTFIVYGVAIVGSIYGGSIPMTLIKKGMPVYKARMTAMFLIALAPLAVLLTQFFGNVGPVRKNLGPHTGGGHDLHRRLRAPGLVGQPVYHRLRYVPEESCRLDYRHWYHGGWHRRRNRATAGRTPHRRVQESSPNRLPHHVRHLRPQLSDCVGDHENARAQTQTYHGPVSIFPDKKPVEAAASTG